MTLSCGVCGKDFPSEVTRRKHESQSGHTLYVDFAQLSRINRNRNADNDDTGGFWR